MTSAPPWALAAASLFAAAALAGAQQPYLVRDIDPGPGSEAGSGASPTRVGDRIFLRASDEEHGSELWVTDGTAAGTRLLRDICPGICPSSPVVQGSLGDRLLFSAATEASGPHRLWISDGTWEGTRPLGSGPLVPQSAVGRLVDRGLFFFAAEHDDRAGLWVTDGTRGGTRPLGLDAAGGWPTPFIPGDPDGQGVLVFGAFNPGFGDVPWVTDGTDAGTRPLFTPETAQAEQQLRHFARLPAGTIFITRFLGGPCRTTLWVSDGTLSGTRPIRFFDEPECFDVVDSPVLATGDAAYFVVSDRVHPPQLWRSDGTAPGTRAVTSFTHDAFSGSSTFSKAATDDALLFVADDGVSGFEPWLADTGGVRRIADLCPGACSSHPTEVVVLGDRFYFTAHDDDHGGEIWTSDGTAAGTRLIADACPGDCLSFPTAHAVAGGLVYFTADHSADNFERELWAAPIAGGDAERLTDLAPDFPFGSPFLLSAAPIDDDLLFNADDGAHGSELWRSDGTPGGTRMVADLTTAPLAGASSAPVRTLAWRDGVFFFAHEPDVGYQPWISDGTEGGTRRLGVITTSRGFSVQYSRPLALGDEVLFVASAFSGGPLELWRTDGDGAPVRLAELTGSGALPSVRDFVRLGDRVLGFLQNFSSGESGIWVSDGTAAGTRQLDAVATANFAFTGYSGELNGKLYFSGAAAPSEDFELWSTDGTDDGTALVANLATGSNASFPGEFARLGNRLLFAADTPAAGRELWVTDGTAAGTRMVADLIPGSVGSLPRYLSAIGDRVVFVARGESGLNDFWVSDGTAAGTVRLSAFPGDVFNSHLSSLHAVANGRLFLMFANYETFPESQDLWVSDGTVAGTGNLAPLFPPGSTVSSVWSAGDRVRVAMWVERPFETTHELWETDGTFAGTRRLVSLPQVFSAGGIDHLAQVGSLLYFSGPHAEAGQELMALPLGPPLPCATDSETLCLRDGRFAVHARWRDPRSGDTGTAGALPLPGSDRTGLFWFFAPDNVELVFKTLDGGGVNGFFWNFYGALTDVEYTIDVEDTATGRRTEYFNPGGEICGRGDTAAFPARPPVPLPVPAPFGAPAHSAAAAAGADGTACGGQPGDLCLFGDRFRVEVEWADQRSGDTGLGTALPFADRSGFFWFFEPQNVELVVKILDGRPVNGRFWVFYGGLSDVAYTITVTDTETQEEAVYHNPPGEICGRGDTTAF